MVILFRAHSWRRPPPPASPTCTVQHVRVCVCVSIVHFRCGGKLLKLLCAKKMAFQQVTVISHVRWGELVTSLNAYVELCVACVCVRGRREGGGGGKRLPPPTIFSVPLLSRGPFSLPCFTLPSISALFCLQLTVEIWLLEAQGGF